LSLSIFYNPILPGFYPDPSICRVGQDYYLVTSTFAYFPGIPVFHSRDLINWEQIGYALDRPSQLDLDGVGHSEGIFAPTIRYYQGAFYLTTTNISKGGNFIVKANNPAGPWSDPYWLPDAPGIDPSLFFNSDGKAYYVGTRPAPEGPKYFGNWEIWLQELDLKQMKLTGESIPLWRGAIQNVAWPEGPHLYFKNGWYYLLISEGGTDYYHAITVARSKDIAGPYEGNPANPILTHRQLGRFYPIQNVGHGDLVQTQNGEWWMVALGSRPYGGYYRNLGRETFLLPVVWEDGWPVVSPGNGRVEQSYIVPNLASAPLKSEESRDEFEAPVLEKCWQFLRTPREAFWSLSERPSYLRLYAKPARMTDLASPAFIGRRQQHFDFTVKTVMEFQPEPGEEAGLVLIQSNEYQYRFGLIFSAEEQTLQIRLIKCEKGMETVLAKKKFGGFRICLKIMARGQDYHFLYGSDSEADTILIENVNGRILSTDVAGGFVGTFIGVFASGNGKASSNHADFDWFEYEGH
jgi:xylan 1,4-beta-xylosidase